MKIEIVERKAFRIAGLHAKFISILSADATNTNVIPHLWDAFMRNAGQVKNRVGSDMYGVIYASPLGERAHQDELNYIAGVEVSEPGGQPRDFVTREIPAGKFARVTHVGALKNLKATLTALYREALPAAKLEPAGVAEIEVYGKKFVLDKPDSEFDILVSVKPATKKAK